MPKQPFYNVPIQLPWHSANAGETISAVATLLTDAPEGLTVGIIVTIMEYRIVGSDIIFLQTALNGRKLTDLEFHIMGLNNPPGRPTYYLLDEEKE